MGCFEDFIELREATERLIKERGRKLQGAAEESYPQELGLIVAEQSIGQRREE